MKAMRFHMRGINVSPRTASGLRDPQQVLEEGIFLNQELLDRGYAVLYLT